MASDLFNQASFAAGEIGPDLYGRVDQELYYIGARIVRNFIVKQYGGVANRPGDRFVCESPDSQYKTRLIEFQFNEIQQYVLQLTHESMRIIRNGGEVLETAATKNITAITQANPAVFTSNSHGYTDGQDVYISGIVGMIELNGRSLRVDNATTNTFTLTDYQGNAINSSAYGAYVSGGTAARIYTVATPWASDDLFRLNYAQDKDTMTVVHNDYYPRDITRTDHDAWTISLFDVTGGPFKDINATAVTVYASHATGTGRTITASSSIFTANDVGSLFYIEQEPEDTTDTWEPGKSISSGAINRAGLHYYEAQNSATTGTYRPDHVEGTYTDGTSGVQWKYIHSGFGIVKITAQAGTTATVDVIKQLPANVIGSGNTTTIWAKAAWSGAEGYPQAVSYSKRRLIFGATILQPNTIWMSAVRARTSFAKGNPVLDDESIDVPLDGTQVNAVRHLVPVSRLLALTSSSEQVIPTTENTFFATQPPGADPQSNNGCNYVRPLVVGNTVLYVEDTGDVVRTLKYDLGSDSFAGLDLTARSPHLFRNKEIVDWAYQKRPFSVVWCAMSNGAMNGFTFMEEQQVAAWHRHDTDGAYESVCCIREGTENALYKVVRRLINGTYRRYTERAARRYNEELEDAYHVDCGLSYDGRNNSAVTMTISGGTTWDYPESLTITASSASFVATDVGDMISFKDNTVDPPAEYRLTITAYTSSTVVSAQPDKLVPTSHRNASRTDWRFGRKIFRNLHHIEGKDVFCFADGNVIEGLAVSGGAVELPQPAAVVHIGLPFTAELETLDHAQPQGKSKARSMNIPRVFVTVQETRGLWVASNQYGNTSRNTTVDVLNKLWDDGFVEAKQRNPEDGYDLPIQDDAEIFEVSTNSSWSNKGRICIRHSLPTPITVNCLTPEVVYGYS